ncbi:MAG: mechanosensitive ion channel family protein [Opitutaceae bacterium]
MPDEPTSTFNWQSALDETFSDFSRNFLDYIPQLIGAVLLLFIGWGVAHFARIASRRIVTAFDSVFGKLFKQHHSKDERFKKSYTGIIGQIVFWCVMLFFSAATANLLGWNVFSGWMSVLVGFLPRFLTGLLIILAGFLIGNVVLSLIMNTDLKVGETQTAVLARGAQIAFFISACVIGVEHIGLDMHFLTEIVTIIIGVLLAGACLAFGLGAKGMVANTIGAQYMRRNCRVGETISLAGLQGEILEIRQTCIVLDTAEGRAIIPAKFFHEQVSLVQTVTEPTKPETTASTSEAKVSDE